ncbi:Type VI secretion protein, EvpB/VC_A0108, tail sheath [Roseateles sp. YR242]|uniref:type VI secretion system contractile sheath domain-containing protein n=1 Tax=Roseateles sp. YR242 TaxID=1855305 RepID=UPI0008C872AA|nr:type VI secretion system contractile sheath large subunit [Roseateles sp. YR242]SEK22713.1 Type VI secretion protein, EvpB/VC_A0108, tail sheath [Roseateles sp. YR242]
MTTSPSLAQHSRVAILGHFSSRPTECEARPQDRPYAPAGRPVRPDTLDDVLADIAPHLPGTSAVARSMESFHPDALMPHLMPPLPMDGDTDAASASLRRQLQDAGFQRLECHWRGIEWLLHRLDPPRAPAVVLFDISDAALRESLDAADATRSQLHRWLVEEPQQETDGSFSFIVALSCFEATPEDIARLGRAASLATQAGAIWLTAIDSRPLEPIHAQAAPPASALQALEGLRQHPDAAALALFAPPFLLRQPYGAWSNPIDAFPFEEWHSGEPDQGLLWGHPALLALCALGQHPWRGSSAVDRLPVVTYAGRSGDRLALPCTQRLIDLDTAGRLQRLGIAALTARRGEGVVNIPWLRTINGADLAGAGTARQQPASEASSATATSDQLSGHSPATTDGPSAAGPVGTVDTSGASVTSGDSSIPATAGLSSTSGTPVTPDTSSGALPADMDPELAALLKSLG